MLSRFITKSSSFRILTLLSSNNHILQLQPHLRLHTPYQPSQNTFCKFSLVQSHFFSSKRNNGDEPRDQNRNNVDQTTTTSDLWNLSTDDKDAGSVFDEDTGDLDNAGFSTQKEESWLEASEDEADKEADIFKSPEVVVGDRNVNRHVGEDWLTADGSDPWMLGEEEKAEDLFDIGDEPAEPSSIGGDDRDELAKIEVNKQLQEEEKILTEVLKGPDRAFGDLIEASGITDAMIDSLIALKDMGDIEGLPPLHVIEDMRYEKNTRKSARADIERQKQEDIAKARVRVVDEKGRAYGTGKRKCSIARVWIEPGDGKFCVNDKEFDVYFPMIDHRAALLRPFSETKTLGNWNVKCTVKGGGVSGQVGAIQLGISRALQNWEPELRPPLRACGFLTRDSRVVERKKPGKAKARKSFQWVKR
ncbi:30S ribosomal protein S9, mitochondrial [Impatiens glandulifera]|uniref:30S ribosomal protein S9, mitochondrial n=1 Tax=Impatiens glandulifera TaxID=253017 RepID=UPI001FB107D4|nr:30S ribosomal protein S9, mitochondrial [Impatiens glandulifera]